MELIVLLAIGIVIGIPVIAIVALVRSKSAERRVEESWYKISDLQGDIAGLRRDLTRLSDRVSGLESSAVAPRAEAREETRSPSHEAVVAPAIAQDVKAVPVQSSQPAAAASWLEQTTVPLRSRPETATTPAISVEANNKPAPDEIAAFEAPVEREMLREEESVPVAPVRIAECSSATQPVPAAPASGSTPSFAAYKPAAPRESIFRRLKTNLPLEQFLGMNLFAKIGIVLLVLGLGAAGPDGADCHGARSACGAHLRNSRRDAGWRNLARTPRALPAPGPRRHWRRLGAALLYHLCHALRRAYGGDALQYARLHSDAHRCGRDGDTYITLSLASGHRSCLPARFFHGRAQPGYGVFPCRRRNSRTGHRRHRAAHELV